MGNCCSAEVPSVPQKSGTNGITADRGGSNYAVYNNRPASSPAKPKKIASESNTTGSLQPTKPKDVEDFRQKAGNCNVHIFTYSEMRAATRNFRPDQILGEGGFGIVYKGVIDENVRSGFKSTQVAVKELNPEGFQGDREWLAEVNYLGQFSHPNLVKLIGYCCEDEHRLLVYEYMACGSLEKHLFRRVCLTMPWPTRMKIAIGAAKGLAFLHGAERPVIYRDFKTSNILLDAVRISSHLRTPIFCFTHTHTHTNFYHSFLSTSQYGTSPYSELSQSLYCQDYNANLSDFGLAKEGPMGDQTHVSTRVMGTYGYAAPEYVMTGHLTARSDVYGYGVVLLEMLIGRRAMDKSRPSREHNLVEWARPLLMHNRKLLKIIDPRMEGQYTVKTIQKVANMTYQCLSQNPKGRPTMSQVVEILESLQGLPENREGLLDGGDRGGGAVTLYEVRGDVVDSSERTRSPSKTEDRRKPKVRSGGEDRAGKHRSKSEPSLYGMYSPSPDSDDSQM